MASHAREACEPRDRHPALHTAALQLREGRLPNTVGSSLRIVEWKHGNLSNMNTPTARLQREKKKKKKKKKEPHQGVYSLVEVLLFCGFQWLRFAGEMCCSSLTKYHADLVSDIGCAPTWKQQELRMFHVAVHRPTTLFKQLASFNYCSINSTWMNTWLVQEKDNYLELLQSC